MPHVIRFLLVIFLLTLVANEAKSCSCTANTNDIKTQITWHNLIFSGKLVSAKVTKRVKNGNVMDDVTLKFLPDKFWRGIKTDTVIIFQENSFCSPRLISGKTYVIYNNLNQRLSTCSRLVEDGIETEKQRLDKLFTRKRFKQLQAAS